MFKNQREQILCSQNIINTQENVKISNTLKIYTYALKNQLKLTKKICNLYIVKQVL